MFGQFLTKAEKFVSILVSQLIFRIFLFQFSLQLLFVRRTTVFILEKHSYQSLFRLSCLDKLYQWLSQRRNIFSVSIYFLYKKHGPKLWTYEQSPTLIHRAIK